MVPAGLEPLTGLLGLVGYLRVVRWSIGKAGGGSCDGLHGHRIKVALAICLGTKHVQRVCALVHAQVLPYTRVVLIHWVDTCCISLVLSITWGYSHSLPSQWGLLVWALLLTLLCLAWALWLATELAWFPIVPSCAHTPASGAGRPPLELEGVIPWHWGAGLGDDLCHSGDFDGGGRTGGVTSAVVVVVGMGVECSDWMEYSFCQDTSSSARMLWV